MQAFLFLYYLSFDASNNAPEYIHLLIASYIYNMLRPIDNFFLNLEEPIKSTMLFLRSYIPTLSDDISEEWKYKLPFYYYKGKMFCYLWIHKKYKQPYIGIVAGEKLEHPDLLLEKRARMKILLVNPEADIEVEKIKQILQQAMKHY